MKGKEIEYKLKLRKPQKRCATKVYLGYGYRVSVMDEEQCGLIDFTEYADILKEVSEMIEEIKERYDELNTFVY